MNKKQTGKNSLQEPASEKITESKQSPTYVLNKEDKSQYGEIIEVEPIDQTPFNIITIGKDHDPLMDEYGQIKCFIAIGNQRITEMDTYVNCLKLIQEKQWGLLLSCIAIIAKATQEEINKEKIEEMKKMLDTAENNHKLLKAMNGREDENAWL